MAAIQPRRGKIVDLGWTDAEVLVVLYASGIVDMYVSTITPLRPFQTPTCVVALGASDRQSLPGLPAH
jgi:hypothetical protein